MKAEQREQLRPILERTSCRRFRGDPIPEEEIDLLAETLIRAPSAGNLQPWLFLIVQDAGLREALADAALGQAFVAEAPVVFVICMEPARSAVEYGDRGRTLYAIQDTAAATENLLIAATALGLGSCWIGAFEEEEVHRILGLPAGMRPVAMVPVGCPARAKGPTERRPRSEVLARR